MGFFRGIAQGFGCVGQALGFVIGAALFVVVAGAVLKACSGG